MMKCVDLIEKVKTEFYQGEYMDYHESTFEFVDIPENERGDWYEEGIRKERLLTHSRNKTVKRALRMLLWPKVLRPAPERQK